MNNKYQQALDNLVHCKSETKCKDCNHKDRCTMDRDYKILKELVDKETPVKVIEEEYSKRKDYKWKCPNCYNFIYKHEAKIWTYEYCPKCGQKLDWSEDE